MPGTIEEAEAVIAAVINPLGPNELSVRIATRHRQTTLTGLIVISVLSNGIETKTDQTFSGPGAKRAADFRKMEDFVKESRTDGDKTGLAILCRLSVTTTETGPTLHLPIDVTKRVGQTIPRRVSDIAKKTDLRKEEGSTAINPIVVDLTGLTRGTGKEEEVIE